MTERAWNDIQFEAEPVSSYSYSGRKVDCQTCTWWWRDNTPNPDCQEPEVGEQKTDEEFGYDGWFGCEKHTPKREVE